MIETQATVTSVEPGYAWIESERRSGCSHCSRSRSCGVSSISQLFGVQRLRMRLPDTLGVQAGDELVIGLAERRLVAAAAMAYMLPLLSMILLALAGVHLGYGQVSLALLSLTGLVTGLWLVRYRINRDTPAHRYAPVMLRKQAGGLCETETATTVKGVPHE